jgi:hypothetical protein
MTMSASRGRAWRWRSVRPARLPAGNRLICITRFGDNGHSGRGNRLVRTENPVLPISVTAANHSTEDADSNTCR